jgi:preprotein translocase subunit SecE
VRKLFEVNIYIKIAIWAGLILAAFIVAWRAGYIAQLSTYVQGTREELKKCTWPTWDELKGSTVVVAISIVILGAFTMFADFVFTHLVKIII